MQLGRRPGAGVDGEGTESQSPLRSRTSALKVPGARLKRPPRPQPSKGTQRCGEEPFTGQGKVYSAADASSILAAGWRPIVTVEPPQEGRGGVVSQRLRLGSVSRGQAGGRRKPAPSATEAHCVRRRTQPPSVSWSAQFPRRPRGGAKCGEKSPSQYPLPEAVVATASNLQQSCCPTRGKGNREPRGRNPAGRSGWHGWPGPRGGRVNEAARRGLERWSALDTVFLESAVTCEE